MPRGHKYLDLFHLKANVLFSCNETNKSVVSVGRF